MSATHEYDFDVAFSFHSKDEALAAEINALSAQSLRTFLYSEKQKEIAGRDGQEAFSAVYAKRSRIVAILYREEWGQTPFTRIEQTAIKNRAFDEGFDFTIFIVTDPKAQIPQWLPKTRLWLNYERFGATGAAAAIEVLAVNAGAIARPETAIERAGRINDALALKEHQRVFRFSEVGVTRAIRAFEEVRAEVERICAQISASKTHCSLALKRTPHSGYLMRGMSPWLLFDWEYHYANSLDDSKLWAVLYSGPVKLPGTIPPFEEGRQLARLEFDYSLMRADEPAYFPRKKDQGPLTPSALADLLVQSYLRAAEQVDTR